ncbi:hypothetical protein ACWGR4_46135 [Embleya sp. NPDC055664]
MGDQGARGVVKGSAVGLLGVEERGPGFDKGLDGVVGVGVGGREADTENDVGAE